MDFEEVKSLIKSGLENASVGIQDLTGTKDHLSLIIISDSFEGKALLQQHRMVMDILSEKLKAELHAVQLKTLTYAKAQAAGIDPETL